MGNHWGGKWELMGELIHGPQWTINQESGKDSVRILVRSLLVMFLVRIVVRILVGILV